MNIYEKITKRILFYLDNMNNDEEFKKNNPDITAQEYLCAKVNPNITPKRLVNILKGKAKRITLQEVCIICYWLNIEVPDLFRDIE